MDPDLLEPSIRLLFIAAPGARFCSSPRNDTVAEHFCSQVPPMGYNVSLMMSFETQQHGQHYFEIIRGRPDSTRRHIRRTPPQNAARE